MAQLSSTAKAEVLVELMKNLSATRTKLPFTQAESAALVTLIDIEFEKLEASFLAAINPALPQRPWLVANASTIRTLSAEILKKRIEEL